MGYYDCIITISCLALITLCCFVRENGRIKDYDKRYFYAAATIIFVSCVSEWGGVILNGAAESTVTIHRMAKCMDYVTTPMAGVFVALAITPTKSKIRTVMTVTALINIVVQVLSYKTGWTFYIDENNYYQHGPFFVFYNAVSILLAGCVIAEFILYGKRLRTRNYFSLVLTVLIMVFGIGAQELFGGEVMTTSLSLTLALIFLFTHFTEYTQVEEDISLLEKDLMLSKDPLTGLLSRFAFNKMMEDSEKGSLDMDFTSVASADVNYLKKYNDTYGHQAGDDLIRGAADALMKVFSEKGKCYRTGGDEFVIVSTADSTEMEKLLKRFHAETEKWQGKNGEHLNVSIGYATRKLGVTPNLADLVGESDRKMYRAKELFHERMKEESR